MDVASSSIERDSCSLCYQSVVCSVKESFLCPLGRAYYHASTTSETAPHAQLLAHKGEEIRGSVILSLSQDANIDRRIARFLVAYLVRRLLLFTPHALGHLSFSQVAVHTVFASAS